MQNSAACPVCDADVGQESGMVLGELLTCPECGTELEVINLDPFELDEAPQEEEDWGQ